MLPPKLKSSNEESFGAMVERDRCIVTTWPEWMQRIVITAETAITGKFIRGKNES